MQFLYTSQTAVYCDLYSPSPEYTRTVHSTAAIKFNIRVVQVLHGSIPRLNDVKCVHGLFVKKNILGYQIIISLVSFMGAIEISQKISSNWP